MAPVLNSFHTGDSPSDPDELRYRSLFCQPSVGIVELDRRGCVRRVNARFCELAQPSPIDLYSRPFVELLPVGVRANCDAAVRSILATADAETDGDDCNTVLRCDGLLEQRVDAKLTLCGLRTDDGRMTGILVLVEDVTEFEDRRRELERELEEQREVERRQVASLHVLLGELVDAERRARERLARNLHGAVQQQILAALLHLPATPPSSARPLLEVRALLREALDLTRSLAHELQPAILDEGLLPGLEWLVEEYERNHGLKVHLELDRRAEPRQQTARFVLFEVVRELLLNVVKHAGARDVQVQVLLDGDDERQDSAGLQIVVRDDGNGFEADGLFQPINGRTNGTRWNDDPATDGLPSDDRPTSAPATNGQPTGEFGLRDVRHRVDALGGRVDFESAPGQGTRVTIHAPLGPSAERREPTPAAEAPLEAPLEAVLVGDE